MKRISAFHVAVVLLLGIIVVFLGIDLGFGFVRRPPGWTEVDAVTVVLSALGVILVVMTIFLGVGAVIGYNSIRDATLARAESASKSVARVVARRVAEETATAAAIKAFARAPGESGYDEHDDGNAGSSPDRDH